MSTSLKQASGSIPRVSGDEPDITHKEKFLLEYSPRERG